MALGQSVAKRIDARHHGPRHRRRVVLLRRRRHHAGHLGAVGGRRPEARLAGLRVSTSCRSRSSSLSACLPCSRAARRTSPNTSARSPSCGSSPSPSAASSTSSTTPTCFVALNPWYGVRFLIKHGLIGLAVLGLVFLAVTGAEALYADLGHFGRKPIQVAWFSLILPALLLNYYGQGALVLANPAALENPFYLLYPDWALIPMVILATARHHHRQPGRHNGRLLADAPGDPARAAAAPRHHPHVRSDVRSDLPAARQLDAARRRAARRLRFPARRRTSPPRTASSVTAAMVIDTLLAFFVVWRYWKWPLWQTALILIPLLLLEQVFLTANFLKVFEGGWVPLLLAACIGLIMVTWVRGSRLLVQADAQERSRSRLAAAQARGQAAASGAGHRRVLHRRSDGGADRAHAQPEAQPRPARAQHHPVHPHRGGAARAALRARHRRPGHRHLHPRRRALRLHGNAERAEDPRGLPAQGSQHRHRRDVVLPVAPQLEDRRRNPRCPLWQDQLFVALARSAQDATTYFQIPTDRVVEVGTQVAV